MTPDRTIRELLEDLASEQECIEFTVKPHLAGELADNWRAAEAEAEAAYRQWRRYPGPDAYLVYRAAEERAHAGQEALRRWTGTHEAWRAAVDAVSVPGSKSACVGRGVR